MLDTEKILNKEIPNFNQKDSNQFTNVIKNEKESKNDINDQQ